MVHFIAIYNRFLKAGYEVAVGSQVMQTITGAILSLASGATILIATATGAKDHRKVAETIGTSICFFGIVALAVTVAMVLLHEQVALAMHTPVEAMRDTTNYILICSLGIPFIFGYNVVCGIMRGHCANCRLHIRPGVRKCAGNQLPDAVSDIGNHGLLRKRRQMEIAPCLIDGVRNIRTGVDQSSVKIEDHAAVHFMRSFSGTGPP